MSLSPTTLTLRHLRAEGWTVEVVERWNPHARIRQDLFGFIDLLAIRGNETLAVQTTSATNAAARLNKIVAHENARAVLRAGWRIEVHGWKKVRGKWALAYNKRVELDPREETP